MRFSKLDDTRFPNLDTVNVYSFKNNFDYTRWSEGTKITLTNVLWNSDYKDVVKFDTNEERDSYFDNLSDTHVIKLQSNQRIIPDAKSYNYVDLPVPYDIASRYNYIVVEVPIATSPDDMIDYETDAGVRRWYFFLDMVTYNAPNTTTCYVTIDAWTNFINDVLIKYMVLERGHAPVSVTDVDTYLANPIENNEYLLAPDVDFGDTKVTKSGTFIPFGNGTKYVCMASTCAPQSLQYVRTVTTDPNYNFNSNVTFSDASFRSGFQYNVDGYGLGNGKNYENLSAPATNTNGDKRLETNNYVYAIPATQANRFFDDMRLNFPSFMRTLIACFIVDEAMLHFEAKYNIGGHEIIWCTGTERDMGSLTLTKDMFGYGTQYARFAKLYTYPYASLELTDNDGKTVEVRIEDTGHVGIKAISSVAFPYLNMRCFFTGIGGVGSQRYSWKQLDGTTVQRDMPNADWFKYCFDMEIPTFAVYMDGETSFMLDNFNTNLENIRRSALVNYKNSVRAANNSALNAIDINNIGYDCAEASLSTSVTNNDNNCSAQESNAALVTSTNSANVARENSAATTINQLAQSKNADLMRTTNTAAVVTADVTNDRSVATTANSADASVQSSAISGASSGAMGSVGLGAAAGTAIGAAGGGVAAGAAAGAAGGTAVAPGVGTAIGAVIGLAAGALIGGITASQSSGVTAHAANTNAMLASGANSAVVNAANAANILNAASANSYSGQTQDAINSCKTDVVNNNNASHLGQVNTNAATARTNARNNYDTGVVNADRTRNIHNYVSHENQYTSVDNSKNTLINTRDTARAQMKAAWKKQPVPVCSASGDNAMDYNQTRGVQIKVRRESDSAIAQAGDMFARYGYALNRAWDVERSGLKLMRNFTYWKCDDVWVDDVSASNNNVINTISKIFTSGVTVWSDADKIGKVSVYDN